MARTKQDNRDIALRTPDDTHMHACMGRTQELCQRVLPHVCLMFQRAVMTVHGPSEI